LKRIADGDRKLRRSGVFSQADEATNRHDPLGIIRDRRRQGDMVAPVHLNEVPRVGVAQTRLGDQEPLIAALGRKPLKGGLKPWTITTMDRADRHFSAAAKRYELHASSLRDVSAGECGGGHMFRGGH